MIYLEHYLREGGVTSLSSVVILAPGDAGSMCRDLAAEFREIHPAADVRIVLPHEAVPACDLLVAIFDAPSRFPLQDAVYEALDRLEGLRRHERPEGSVMIYGVWWRSVEVLPWRALPGFVRKRRAEARLIRLLERSRLLRRVLRPLYA